MPTIRIEQDNKVSAVQCDDGSTLLSVLHDHGFDVYSPCGGRGICGKCQVHVREVGQVTSCSHHVSKDIDVVLPDKREAMVLVDQHRYTRQFKVDPGIVTGLTGNPFGVAIDIGTTTIALHLADLLKGTIVSTGYAVNPQTRYGADVISRINVASQSPEGLKKLQEAVISEINRQIGRLARESDIGQSDIVKLTIAGNTTMLHLLLGVDPLPLALVPFRPAFTDEQVRQGRELGLHCHEGAEVKLLPSLAAYIGADVVAGIASIHPTKNIEKYLFIDIGTNGEMALVTPGRIWCCATAAGPAFEGASISCGMSAVDGAISAYDASGAHVIGNADPEGICGSGLIDLAAWLLNHKLVDQDGTMAEDFVISHPTKEKKGVRITQQDMRELQLAKAAIRAGINGLMRRAGFSPDNIDALFLAGGFGNYIDIANAGRIGMLPTELLRKTASLGNTSLTGAYLALISTEFEQIIQDVRTRSEHFELNEDDGFMTDFVMNMSF